MDSVLVRCSFFQLQFCILLVVLFCLFVRSLSVSYVVLSFSFVTICGCVKALNGFHCLLILILCVCSGPCAVAWFFVFRVQFGWIFHTYMVPFLPVLIFLYFSAADFVVVCWLVFVVIYFYFSAFDSIELSPKMAGKEVRTNHDVFVMHGNRSVSCPTQTFWRGWRNLKKRLLVN